MRKYSKAGTALFLLVLAFGLSAVLGGCAISNKDKQAVDDDNWEDDVLWARECGQDGLRCCDGEDPCFYGQECCVDANNPKRNRCSDNCECGIEGNFCCAGDACGAGLGCSQGFCVPCGELNDPCCADNACNSSLLCYRNKCVACGTPGNPCCNEDIRCQGQNEAGRGRTDCIDGLCIYCGTAGKIVCESEPVCAPGNLVNNGYCLACGGENQPCCDDKSGLDYVCDPSKDLACDRGFCTGQ